MSSPGRTPDYTGDGGGSGGFALPVFIAASHGIKDDPIASEIAFGSGAFRVRRVDVVGPATVTGSWQMSAVMFNDFVTWYEQDLRAGTLAFNLTVMNFGPGVVSRVALFLEPYQATTDDGLNYIVTAKLQIADTHNIIVPGGGAGPGDPSLSTSRLPYQVYLLDTFSADEPPIVVAPPTPAYSFPDEGSIIISGLAPVPVIGYVTQPAAGSITMTGAVPLVLRPIDSGSIVITGQLPTIALSGSSTVRPDVGAIAITTYAPNPISSTATFSEHFAVTVVCSDRTTALTTGTDVASWRSPFAFTLTSARSALKDASTSGLVTVDVKRNGTSIFTTKITVDANEETSVTAATPHVLTSSTIAVSDDDEFTFNIDGAGTAAKGLQTTLIGTVP